MTEPEPAAPDEAGPANSAGPPIDPVSSAEPALRPDAVLAAATAAATRALRRQLDAEAKAALAELLAAGADSPPVLPDPAAADGPTTWAETVRAAVRRAVGTALTEAVITDEPAESAGEPEPVEPLCADVTTWVEHVYAPTFIRRISQTERWCASWWGHPEAIVRLQALWQTWEAARAAAGGAAMADWLRLYLDQINPVLLSPDGPFAACTTDRHTEPVPLPVTAPPADYWTTS